MSESTPDSSPDTDAGTTTDTADTPDAAASGATGEAADADVTPAAPDGAGDDGGAALERAQEAIDEAQDAQGSVAANDDITSHDDALAGEYSEDPDGAGGHP